MDDSSLVGFDSAYKVNPPFRTKTDNKALIKSLQDGTVDVLVSNHLPHDEEAKNLEFDLADFGIISQQTLAHNLAEMSQMVDMHVLIEKVATNPRTLLKIEENSIEEGSKADLTLFDPDYIWALDASSSFSKSENTPYWNKELKGKAMAVFNNGKSYLHI